MDIEVFEREQQTASDYVCSTDRFRRSSRYPARSLLMATALALLPLYAMAGNVTYNSISDTSQIVEQGAVSLPFTFIATSPALPATGKPKQTPYASYGCVNADYVAKDLSYTYLNPETQEPVTVPLDFSGWLAITPSNLCYTAPMSGPEVATTVSVPGNAELGMYTAKLVAKAANGIGWGEGAGVHITVNVVEPTATDTTPPVVTILEPMLDNGNPQNFVLGNRIPTSFTAIDQQSSVTGWTASLYPGPLNISSLLDEGTISDGDGIEADGYILSAVPGGSETIQTIGQYSLQVAATSAGGTSDPTSRLFNVNYQVNPIAPDLTQSNLVWDKTVNTQGKCSGPGQQGTMQVKFAAQAVQPADTALLDNSTEAFVADRSVRVHIIRDSDNALRFNRSFGTTDTTDVVINGSTGATSGEYFTKVNLCNETVGSYTIRVYFQDHSSQDFLQYSKQFTLQ